MYKRTKKFITLVTLSFAFLFVAVGLTPSTTEAAYYGGSHILASDYYVAPGQQITITGKLFYPNETVTLSASGRSKDVQVNGAGEFAANITVPHTRGEGRLAITALGDMSRSLERAEIVVAGFYPTISPDRYFLFPGDTVTISGQGFAPGETIAINHNGVAKEAVAGGGGSFSIQAKLMTSGPHRFTFNGETSGASVARTVYVATPWWN